MKYIILTLCIVGLAGCSTPNPNPKATEAAYEKVKCGMSRDEVYALLGQPESAEPVGDVMHCHSATWSIPHDAHGSGHWTVIFAGDTVTTIKTGHAIFSMSH